MQSGGTVKNPRTNLRSLRPIIPLHHGFVVHNRPEALPIRRCAMANPIFVMEGPPCAMCFRPDIAHGSPYTANKRPEIAYRSARVTKRQSSIAPIGFFMPWQPLRIG